MTRDPLKALKNDVLLLAEVPSLFTSSPFVINNEVCISYPSLMIGYLACLF